MLYQKDYFYNSLYSDMDCFYDKLNQAQFKKITPKRLIELKANSLELNKYLNNEHSKFHRVQRYIKIMNKLRTRSKEFGISKDNELAEMYFTFMFAVDPDFEAAIICGECNRTSEIKEKMSLTFGICDVNLIVIENYYLKYFASEKRRKKVNEEIDKRVFK